jgi:hypothetical protein
MAGLPESKANAITASVNCLWGTRHGAMAARHRDREPTPRRRNRMTMKDQQ